jgi:hypothetical protein
VKPAGSKTTLAPRFRGDDGGAVARIHLPAPMPFPLSLPWERGCREAAGVRRHAGVDRAAFVEGRLELYPAAVSLITSSSVVIPRCVLSMPSMRRVSIPSEIACSRRSAVEAPRRIMRRSWGDIAITS